MRALITGASSGIGWHIAELLAKEGWDLVLCARREKRLLELKNKLTDTKVDIIRADLADKYQCIALFERAKKMDVDMFVCNAGFGIAGSFLETELDRELEMINTNVVAMHILIKLFAKHFSEKGEGQILVTASSAGFFPGPKMATYYSTKNYVLRLCEALYEELRQTGSNVKISVLCPGPVDTEFDQVADVKFSMKGLTAEYTAEYALKQAKKGKLFIVPGISMKLGVWFRHFISEKMLSRIVCKIQDRKIK